MFRVLLLLFILIALTFCKSPYKTSSATLPRKDSKNTTKQDQKELKKHMEKQEQKVIESEDLEHKYIAPSKRKKRGEVPPQETFY
ncbi:MAG: hypothetical protein JWM14_2971 [Chitinophagaceae bacterium]|nr:hypothetical protein [Chitinophagaceae bacterium]